MAKKKRKEFPHNGDGENLVLSDRRVIIVPIGKCASQTLKQLVMDAYSIPPSDLYKFKVSKEWVAQRKRDLGYFIFAVVRNPFDRLVSCYLDKTQRTFYKGMRLIRGMSKGMPFERFVRIIGRVPDVHQLCDGHFRSQTDHLFTNDGVLLPDKVLRCEELEEQWPLYADFMRFPEQLPHKHRSKNRAHYADYYEHKCELIDVVRERYHADFLHFYPEYLD
jgi:hypothetical protein